MISGLRMILGRENRKTAEALNTLLDFCDFALEELKGVDAEEEERIQEAVATIRDWAEAQKEFASRGQRKESRP